ncbi:hypothetical protein GLOIN_2v1624313 [Rhizophagus clarus]|uniref:Uncharacterized protein n=1 Tax=Rhizophagus clarus TaxID=94130 RepID=A0A8H3QT01_9GLOM|nr:hypothetical protein GLOIN_2v1624313 [Rhizophagus clarus]
MKEMNIEDRKQVLSVSPKEKLVQPYNDDFERDADQNESHQLALVYESDPTERNIPDPYDKNSRYSEE